MTTFVFTLLTLSTIAVVVDSSEKADDFVKSGLSGWEIVTQYYIGFVPFIISMIFPLMVFIAVIFFTSKMASRSEIVAILAGGVRFNRMLRPYLIGGIFLALILWVASQRLIPKAQTISSAFKAKYIDANSSYQLYSSSSYYLRIDPVTFVGIRHYDTTYKSITGFFLQKIKGNKVYYNLRADILRWDTVRHDWKVENGIERKINGLKEEVRRVDTLHLNLNIQPGDLHKDEYLKDKLTTAELKRYIKLEELRGSEGLNTLKVERYHRDASPFSVIILSLIGVMVSSRKTRGGSGLHLAIGIVVAAVFVVMDRFSTVFSTKGNMHPFLAAWMPNIIFGMVAYILYRKAPK